MLKVGEVKEIYEMKGAGRSIRGIAGDLGIARNTVRRYLNSPEAIRPTPSIPTCSSTMIDNYLPTSPYGKIKTLQPNYAPSP